MTLELKVHSSLKDNLRVQSFILEGKVPATSRPQNGLLIFPSLKHKANDIIKSMAPTIYAIGSIISHPNTGIQIIKVTIESIMQRA